MNSSSSTVPSPSTSRSPNISAAFSPAFIWTWSLRSRCWGVWECNTNRGLTLTSRNTQCYQCFVPLILPPFHTRFQLFLTSLSTRWFLNITQVGFMFIIESEWYNFEINNSRVQIEDTTKALRIFHFFPTFHDTTIKFKYILFVTIISDLLY